MKTKTKLVLIILSLLTLSMFTSLQVSFGTNSEDSTAFVQLKSSLGTYEEGKNYNQIIYGHGTGLIPPSEEEWQKIAQELSASPQLATSEELPASVDWSASAWFPPIGDQAKQGSCAAWAIGYYVKTFQEAKEHSWDLSEATWTGTAPSAGYQDKIMSPSFIYNLLNGGVDGGLSFENPIQLISLVGVCSWQQMPYTDKDFSTWPSEAAWREAALYRGDSSSYQFIDVDSSEGLANLKSLLASGNLALTAVDAYKFANFTDNDVLVVDRYVDLELNHAATIVGYDDSITYVENGQLRQGAFKVANSWGIEQVHANMTNWEHVLDGCYWISYETMKQQVGWCVYYNDMVDYQPSLLAEFQIDHSLRGEVSITVGLGSPSAPIATKVFAESKTYSDTSMGCVFGGNHSFCANKIVLDISEFTAFSHSLYNQPFFLKVHDSGTSLTGNVTYFSINNYTCTAVPVTTEQFENVYLTVNYTFASPTLTISPTSGPPSTQITLNGTGFNSGSSLVLSYLNPVTSTWTPIVNNLTVSSSTNFTYPFNVPDLMQANPSGDNPPVFDQIVFRAYDPAFGYTCNATAAFTEGRRGLTQLGTTNAAGLYGNNTDLTSTVFVQAGQSLVVAGQGFSLGNITLLWADTTPIGTAAVDANGAFNTTVTVPSTSAGVHSILIHDANTNFRITLSRLPQISINYSAFWHTNDFTINLSPDYSGTEIFYRLNNGSVCSVSVDGQPRITAETSTGTLEYWGTWDLYGTGNIELSHVYLTALKLDKTPPTGTITSSAHTNTTVVSLALSATDAISGVMQMRFSNDNLTWSNWETYSASKLWTLQSGNGEKTVFVQYKDNAGLISTYSCTITLEFPQPTATPTQTTTPTVSPSPSTTPQIPEFNAQITLLLIVLLSLSAVIFGKYKGKQPLFNP